MRVRGVPLVLARYDGRFYELYTADDDFSYDDALLVGERLYRRDLLTGDSALVFADTHRAAHRRARTRGRIPTSARSARTTTARRNPSTSATAEIDILDVAGPYLSYEYHVDVDLPGRRLWHTTRRGVIDLRSGQETSRRRSVRRGRRAPPRRGRARVYEATRDSIVRAREHARATTTAAPPTRSRGLQFDERSFSLADDRRRSPR